MNHPAERRPNGACVSGETGDFRAALKAE